MAAVGGRLDGRGGHLERGGDELDALARVRAAAVVVVALARHQVARGQVARGRGSAAARCSCSSLLRCDAEDAVAAEAEVAACADALGYFGIGSEDER